MYMQWEIIPLANLALDTTTLIVVEEKNVNLILEKNLQDLKASKILLRLHLDITLQL